jgi:hypothetical protein
MEEGVFVGEFLGPGFGRAKVLGGPSFVGWDAVFSKFEGLSEGLC